MLGRVSAASGVSLETIHRFPNGVVELDGGLRWDFDALFAEVLKGLAAAAAVARGNGERIVSIGIDTWAVDYGLVNDVGDLTSVPFSYRDERSRATVERVHAVISPEKLYATTGLQYLQFNTLYQLAAEPKLDGVQALLIPDLIAFLLTGERRTEATNASTTGLFDAVAGEWATEFMDALGLPRDIFPPLIQPGETVGTLLPSVLEQTGLSADTTVVAVGSHDTASAVAAVPAEHEDFAYISSGTWSLVGVELDAPVLTRSQPQGQLHQRTWRGRHHPLPPQRGWPVVAQRMPARVGCAGIYPSAPGPARLGGGTSCRRSANQRGRSRLHRTGQHAGPHPRGCAQHRCRTPGPACRRRAVHHGQPRGRLRPDAGRRRTAHRPQHQRGAYRGRRFAEPAPVPADG